MAKTKNQILLFTENFEKRILAENIIGIPNLESFLNNNRNKNRIILEGVTSCYKENNGNYKAKDHTRGYQIVNSNEIDFVYGPKNIIYATESIPNYGESSLLWGMKGLHHALIGDIRVPGNHGPKINKGSTEKQRKKQEFELISYLDKRLQKNFIPLYNLRTDSADAKKEFAALFKGINLNPSDVNNLLINNRKQSTSTTSQAVYLGKTSKNYLKL